jgi:ubiquinone/menaquinone biosynthesis C-methylase UbiE
MSDRIQSVANSGGSYDVRTIAANTRREVDRLHAQVDLFWAAEERVYEDLRLADAHSVVELGCGPGFLLAKLRAHFGVPRVVGLELDELLVSHAQRHLADLGFDDVEVVTGSITRTGFPDSSFDFAVSRLVLEHVPDPDAALRETYRILRPGGTAIFVDNDFDMHVITHPAIPELRDLYDAYCRLRTVQGGNPQIGRLLPGLMRAAGLTNIGFTVIAAHNVITGDEIFLRSEGIGIPSRLVREGYLSSSTLGRIMTSWRDMLRHENHAIVRQLYVAYGKKLTS